MYNTGGVVGNHGTFVHTCNAVSSELKITANVMSCSLDIDGNNGRVCHGICYVTLTHVLNCW